MEKTYCVAHTVCEDMWRLCRDPINRMCCGLILIPLDKFVASALLCSQIQTLEFSQNK